MHRKLLTFLFICLATAARSQNLVPNPGFETYTSIPFFLGDWALGPPWSNVNGVAGFNWPYASPDYFFVNSGSFNCSLPNGFPGFTYPHSGNGAMGMSIIGSEPDAREYLAVPLTSPMIPGEIYTVSFWKTIGANPNYGSSVNHFGIHFSVGPLTQANHEPIPVTPQLEVPGQAYSEYWQQHSFTIVATAPWTHLTIGLFLPNSQVVTVVENTSSWSSNEVYYYVDDFEVKLYELLATGDTLICEGDSTTLYAQNGTNFSWAAASAPNQVIGTGDSLTVSPAVTTSYFLYSDLDTVLATVTVVPFPEVTANSVTICANQPALLSASGANSYVWSPAAGLDTLAGPDVTVTVSDTVTYMIIGTISGCSDTASVTVTPLPVPVVTVNDTIICAGFSGLLTASGADSYTWSPAAGLNTTTGDSVVASPVVTTVYTVTGTQNGCSSDAQATVTVTSLPLVVDDVEICPGATAVLTVQGADTYVWSPAVTFTAPDGSSVTTMPAVTTVYTVTGTNAAGDCWGTAQATVTLVDPAPTSITASANPLLMDNPLVTLTGQPDDALLIWHFGDGVSAEGAQTQHLFPPGEEGIYEVMLISLQASGCTDTAYLQIVVLDGGLYYVPNAFSPNGDACNNQFFPVFSAGFSESEYTMEIYDRLGELVFATNSYANGWDGTYRGLASPPDVYTWKIAIGKAGNAEAITLTGFVTLVR